jgi:hypothetical protein
MRLTNTVMPPVCVRVVYAENAVVEFKVLFTSVKSRHKEGLRKGPKINLLVWLPNAPWREGETLHVLLRAFQGRVEDGLEGEHVQGQLLALQHEPEDTSQIARDASVPEPLGLSTLRRLVAVQPWFRGVWEREGLAHKAIRLDPWELTVVVDEWDGVSFRVQGLPQDG